MRSSSGITFRLETIADLPEDTRAVMFRLLSTHFDGITREQFDRDLSEKDLALLLEKDCRLAGFSTLLAYSTCHQSEQINVIYSGDTIVAPDAWGSTALPRAWVAGVRRLQATLPRGRCYWLLLTSGFRTYRFLSVFWREFFPRYDRATPASVQQLLNAIADERFGRRFDSDAGVVRFCQPQRLRNSEIPAGRDLNPHTEFFLKQNPGHSAGDELVCLTELRPENLTPAGLRIMPSDELAGRDC